MENREERRTKRLMYSSMGQFEEHSKRVDSILESIRGKFNRDYTGLAAGVGTLFIGASIILGFLDRQPLVSIAGIASGTVLVIIALMMRHRVSESQIKYTQSLMELERERASAAQKAAVLSDLWLYGLPEGTTLEQVRLLLSETAARSTGDLYLPSRMAPSDD